jgi:hypothetical protein
MDLFLSAGLEIGTLEDRNSMVAACWQMSTDLIAAGADLRLAACRGMEGVKGQRRCVEAGGDEHAVHSRRCLRSPYSLAVYQRQSFEEFVGA